MQPASSWSRICVNARHHKSCYVDIVTLRHAALPIGAVLVLGLGIYLFHEVRSQPAIAQVAPTPHPHPAPEQPAVEPPPAAPQPQVAVKPQQPVVMPTAPQQVKDEPPPQVESHELRFNNPVIDGPNPKLDAVMDEANKAYDHGDFDEAKTVAQKVLAKQPTNIRMLRIMVSASCIDGDTGIAQANFAKLPPADQEQMRVRCARYGVTFDGTPGK